MTKFSQRDARNLILSIAGQANILTIPRVFIGFTGDLETALFLSQLLYWQSRTDSQWVYKTFAEWENELSLNTYRVNKARRKLEEMGLLRTEVRKANGAPTVHYHLDGDALADSLTSFLANGKPTQCKMENQQGAESKTNRAQEPVTETTSETTVEKATTLKRRVVEPPPPAVQAFREATHRYPNKALYEKIASEVGDDPEDIAFWKEVCLEYIAHGWNPVNITGMLAFYKERRLPTAKVVAGENDEDWYGPKGETLEEAAKRLGFVQ